MLLFSPRCTIGGATGLVNLRKEVNVNDNFFTEILKYLAALIGNQPPKRQGFIRIFA
ncbi:hypothetical protein SMB34_00650 [Thalassospira permensis NBRC 106175]|uniref:Uncharacterized protein n=1 Tax=Thalassospira permensis NBRC 106175 TaxID=1353532 RepID=A0ABR4TTV3_9PROT|nr:hypothetical protein SMB34_00650 [Thalassospira permensis NBRC 106175]